MRLEVSR